MHYRIAPIAVTLALLLAGAAQRGNALDRPTPRHALLIGISKYDHFNHSGLFRDLHCEEDVSRIKTALVKTFEFNPNPAAGEIITLTSPVDTTRSALLAGLDRLFTSTHPGDLVYIHYAGHGQQIPDKTKPTGLGDSIVPSDYRDDLSNVITGRELGAFLRKLQDEKKPSQIVFTLDCCHSGTASRAGTSAIRRGLDYGEYSDWYARHYGGRRPSAPPKTEQPVKYSGGVPPDLRGAGFVVISACTDEGSAYEMTDGSVALGRFSYCLSRALSAATPRTTYRELFAEVKTMFAEQFEDQRPQVDGNPDTYLFGGTAVVPPSAVAVTVDPDGNYILQAGKLHGMSALSLFALYPRKAAERNDKSLIAEAQIAMDSIGLATSQLKITRKIKADLTPSDIAGAQAVEIRHNYARSPLTLDPESVRRALPGQAAAVLARLSDPERGLRMVRTGITAGETADVALYREKAQTGAITGKVEIVRGDTGYLICTLDENGDVPTQVFEALQREARRRYVLDLGARQAQLNRSGAIRVRLVPATAEKDEDGNYIFKTDRVVPDGTPMHIGDYFTVEVQNSDRRPLHVAVLDVESAGTVTPAWPDANSTLEDNIVPHTEPNVWKKLWIGSDVSQAALYRCSSVDPAEVFKVIGTVEYVPFGILARGGRRGTVGAFDDLLGPAVNGSSRGTDRVVVVAPDSWTAASAAFQVVK